MTTTHGSAPRFAVLLALLPLACDAQPRRPDRPEIWRDAAGDTSDPRLASLCIDAWEMRMHDDPVGATYLGDPRYRGDLFDNSVSGEQGRARGLADLVSRGDAIRPLALREDDRVTLEMIVDDARLALQTIASGVDPASWSLDGRSGPQVEFLTLAQDQPVATTSEREDLVRRWRRMPRYVERCGDNLHRGLGRGRVASRKGVQDVIDELDALLATPPEKSPLVAAASGGGEWVEPIPGDHDLAVLASRTKARVADLRAVNELMPARVIGRGSLLLVPSEEDSLSASERGRYANQVYRVVRDEIYPAFRRYRKLLAEEILPHARDDDHPGLCAIPGGDAYYRLCIRRHTTLDLDPRAIHEQGLAEVARIRGEIEALGLKVLGTGEMAEIQRRLRGSAEMHFRTAEEVRAKAEASLARARAAIPATFGILPRAPCVVELVPEHEAPHTTIAYYREPAADGSRPGRYYVNTYAPTTRPRYEAEVLAFHESIPGHHLQIAIAQELVGLPLVRRHAGTTAFVEGWALYTERLCDEMGLYDSDVDRLGMLSYDAWRASRLVVDTGMHALGWSRRQAIEYMTANTLLAENNVANEVDRYVGDPGQALAYKIGQREFLSLRAQAREALGDRFDLRAFHDCVLRGGAVTLTVLRRNVERWIESQLKPATGS